MEEQKQELTKKWRPNNLRNPYHSSMIAGYGIWEAGVSAILNYLLVGNYAEEDFKTLESLAWIIINHLPSTLEEKPETTDG